jgi:hypothetical protein
MHRIRAWGVGLALAAGAGVPAAGADGKPAGAPRDTKAAPQVRPPVIVEPLPPDVLAEAVRAEQDAYIRRLDVCTRLREIAAEKGDDKLAMQAADLERRATAVYEARVAKLGVKPSGKPALPAEVTLDKALGSGAAVNPLTVAPPAPAAPARASLAELREVKP